MAYNDTTGHRRLWAAVLYENLRCAAGNVRALNGGDKPGLDMARSISWIGTPDFEMVCALAGVEPGSAINAVKSGKFDKNVLSRQCRLSLQARERI